MTHSFVKTRRNRPVVRALRSAINKGFDPYDSHPVAAAKWQRAWYDRARRTAQVTP